ncbi:MAG: GNAT family N-acetyltransferase [Oscillospiraceae bacterium]|nr:GNAT family N-acetyltransferase [Oscillospiraceae bacterium]
MKLETERLIITEFTPDMAHDVHVNSLDEDTRRFVPDEVFETEEDAKQTVDFLISCYGGEDGPFVYPVLSRDGANLGYVQLVPIDEGWEIGYHIAKQYTGKGYASEAVNAFLPYIMEQVGIEQVFGICIAENAPSRKVMEKCGFVLLFEGQGEYQETVQNICRYVFAR